MRPVWRQNSIRIAIFSAHVFLDYVSNLLHFITIVSIFKCFSDFYDHSESFFGTLHSFHSYFLYFFDSASLKFFERVLIVRHYFVLMLIVWESCLTEIFHVIWQRHFAFLVLTGLRFFPFLCSLFFRLGSLCSWWRLFLCWSIWKIWSFEELILTLRRNSFQVLTILIRVILGSCYCATLLRPRIRLW